MGRTCIEDGNATCVCDRDYNRCPYKIRKRKMLDQLARGQSPSDGEIYRQVFGPATSQSADASGGATPASKGSGLFGWIVLGVICFGIAESCDESSSTGTSNGDSSTTAASSSPIPAQVPVPFDLPETITPESIETPPSQDFVPLDQNRILPTQEVRSPPFAKREAAGSMTQPVAAPSVETRSSPVVKVGTCIDSDSYPAKALRAHATGTTRLRLSVDAMGEVVDVQVMKSAGRSREHVLLDKAAVSSLLFRCKGLPQTDSYGNAVAGDVDVEVVWKIE